MYVIIPDMSEEAFKVKWTLRIRYTLFDCVKALDGKWTSPTVGDNRTATIKAGCLIEDRDTIRVVMFFFFAWMFRVGYRRRGGTGSKIV